MTRSKPGIRVLDRAESENHDQNYLPYTIITINLMLP